MSLLVWLPLDGNLENQGASAITATNVNATINTSGKIGSCYNFAGSGQRIKMTNPITNEINTFSICTWFYMTAASEALWGARTSGSGAGLLCFLYEDRILFDDGTRFTCSYNVNNLLNSWHHITCVKTPTQKIIYIDGVSIGIQNTTAVTANIKNEITIGNDSYEKYTGNDLIGKMNDFRIYDHALSAAEVHEISQGLVLHYKLDDNVQTITNAFNMNSWNTTTASGGFSVWGSSGHAGSRGTNTDRNYIYNIDRTYSYWIANGENSTPLTYLFYQSPAFEGGYRSLSAILKEENGNLITEDIIRPAWNANVVGEGHAPAAKWTRVTSLGNGFYLCQVDGLYQDGSNDLAGLNVTRGHKVYISEIWLENDRQVASNPIFPLTMIQDSSGYGHNGAITGNLTLINNTPRYSNVTNFDGSSAIKYTSFNLGNEWSAGLWFNALSGITSGWHSLFTVNSNGGDSDLKMNLYLNTANGRIQYSANGQYEASSVTASNKDIWYCLYETFDGSTLKCYLNGELKTTKSITNSMFSRSNLYVGARSTATDGSTFSNQFKGKLSDFRIYATALSADDIKSLYEMGGKIDNKQNLHIYEAIEMRPTIKLTKQGQMKAGEFQEDTATKLYKTDQIIETNNLIEL